MIASSGYFVWINGTSIALYEPLPVILRHGKGMEIIFITKYKREYFVQEVLDRYICIAKNGFGQQKFYFVCMFVQDFY